MLSDEEKKAIEWLKKADWFSARLYSPTILNLIEKLEKEIEELKEDRDEYKEEYIKLQNARYYNYISKDKIKAKVIEVKDRTVKDEFITASQGKLNTVIDMQSLLEKE